MPSVSGNAQFCSLTEVLHCSLAGVRRDRADSSTDRFIELPQGLCMGVATTTDTTDSVRTSFEVFKNLYGMSVQVDETAKSKKEGKAAIWEKFVKATPE